MRIVLVTGGARSGKSRWAEEEAVRLGGDGVTFVATARSGDEEMARRIAAHRAERPAGWDTVEAPRAMPGAVERASTDVVLVDCLTLWVSNLLLSGAESGVRDGMAALLESAAGRGGTLIVVTNEVGLGIVPHNPLARAYRDLLGWSNATLARDAERVVLMVAGIPMRVR